MEKLLNGMQKVVLCERPQCVKNLSDLDLSLSSSSLCRSAFQSHGSQLVSRVVFQFTCEKGIFLILVAKNGPFNS